MNGELREYWRMRRSDIASDPHIGKRADKAHRHPEVRYDRPDADEPPIVREQVSPEIREASDSQWRTNQTEPERQAKRIYHGQTNIVEKLSAIFAIPGQ
ncbi:MAG: hypothetical protein ACJ8HI_07405 [Massilia sp.]